MDDLTMDEINENLEISGDEDDLYDTAIAPSDCKSPVKVKTEQIEDTSNKNDVTSVSSLPPPVVAKPPVPSTSNPNQRRLSCYVSGMTWWTTDEDLANILASIGVHDVVDILIHLNRSNGQSKGFATVCVASDASLAAIVNHLPSKNVDNQQNLVIHSFNKVNFMKLDEALRKSPSDKDIKAEKAPVFVGSVNLNQPRQAFNFSPAYYQSPVLVNRPYAGYGTPNNNMIANPVMERNRAVATSAVARAESYWKEGDSRSTIKTLETAMQLISQSPGSHEMDLRQLLQDLHTKLYNYQYAELHSRKRAARVSRSRSPSPSPRRFRRD